MAELRLSDLPLMTEEQFTSNDRFVVVDDGDARAMPKTVFESWIANNVQGERGEQGVAGRDGINGTNGQDGEDGSDGLSAYQVAVSLGYTGTQKEWIASLKGATGSSGNNGSNGWSPVLKVVARGDDSVLQITDWLGGTGTKPTTLGYLSSTGIVTNISNASNIRGEKGDRGIQGEQGVAGKDGADGLGSRIVQSIVFNPDLSATVTYTDDTTVTSDAPPVQYGWGTYKDGQYNDTATLNIPINTQEVLPNNAETTIEHMPTGYSTFYDPVAQKYILSDTDGFYSVRVRFKVAPSNQPSTINVSMSKATTDIPYSEDQALRGDDKFQDMSFSTEIYGDSPLSTNGLSIRIKTFDRAVSIYNIEVTIAKLI